MSTEDRETELAIVRRAYAKQVLANGKQRGRVTRLWG